IYSMGCLMFETLSGSPPFEGGTALETMMKHLNDEPPALKEGVTGESIPQDLDVVVRKCLAKNPDERFQSMEELEADLKRIRSGEPLRSDEAHPGSKAPNAISRLIVYPLLAAGVVLCLWFVGTNALQSGPDEKDPSTRVYTKKSVDTIEQRLKKLRQEHP